MASWHRNHVSTLALLRGSSIVFHIKTNLLPCIHYAHTSHFTDNSHRYLMVSYMQVGTTGSFWHNAWENGTFYWWILSFAPGYIWHSIKNPRQTCKDITTLVGNMWHWYYNVAKKSINRKYWRAYHSGKNARRAHLRRRRRALTPTGRRAPVQPDCHFLSRLPAEVRNIIYEHYFTENTLLIVPTKRDWHTRLVTFSVPNTAEEDLHLRTRFGGIVEGGLLDLSLACKQM